MTPPPQFKPTCLSYRQLAEELSGRVSRSHHCLTNRGSDAALDGDSRHTQDVRDFGFLEAGGVVLERETVGLFVDAKAAQTVGIGELTEGAELLGVKRALQFVGHFDEGHRWIIATLRI